MSIRKRSWGDGKVAWQVDLLIRGRRLRKQFDTRGEAKKFELHARHKAKEGTFLADGSKVRVRDLVPEYLSVLEKRHERGIKMTFATLKGQRGHLQNYIIGNTPIRWGKAGLIFKGGLGNYRLNELTPDIIETFFENLGEFGKVVKTIREIRNTLIGLLDFARRKKFISVNPARGLRLLVPATADRKRKISVPPKVLIKRIVKISDPTFSFMISFAALTGLRASEQWALRWCHIDFSKAHLRVETRVEDVKKTEYIPKTEAGMRDVPLAGDLLKALSKWRETSTFSGPNDLVFPNEEGKYTSHHAVRDRFYRYYERARASWPDNVPVPPRPRWHDLRHFAISCWIEAGLPPKAIQEFAGHSSLQMTMDKYGHLFPSPDHQQAMDAVQQNVLGPALLHSSGTRVAHGNKKNVHPAQIS